jgi:5-methylcytosine-specific restriction endonuclease McrA
MSCEELSCTNEATINYKDLWMLCSECEQLWSKPMNDRRPINLPHPKSKVRKKSKNAHSGEVFMFGPDAVL